MRHVHSAEDCSSGHLCLLVVLIIANPTDVSHTTQIIVTDTLRIHLYGNNLSCLFFFILIITHSTDISHATHIVVILLTAVLGVHFFGNIHLHHISPLVAS